MKSATAIAQRIRRLGFDVEVREFDGVVYVMENGSTVATHQGFTDANGEVWYDEVS